MILHIGSNEFIMMSDCVGIFNFETLSQDDQKIIQNLFKSENIESFRSVILTKDGKFSLSSLSSDALAGRGRETLFPDTFYLRKKKKPPEKAREK